VIHDQRLVLSLNPLGIVGPAAKHYVCFVCVMVENQCIQWFQWFLKLNMIVTKGRSKIICDISGS